MLRKNGNMGLIQANSVLNSVNVADVFSWYIFITDMWTMFPAKSNHLFHQC